MTPLLAAGGSGSFVELTVHNYQWLILLGLIVALLLVDLLVFHREAHEIDTKEAAVESAVWISIGVAFSLVVLWWFGGAATGEYISGYLIEKSLSIDNVFVWALIMSYFKVPQKYQHRVLFWGIFGALVMRAIFIFAGVALIEAFDWVLYIFGGFLLFTAGRMLFRADDQHIDPGNSRFLKLVNRVIPSTDKLDGPHLFTKINGRRLATPLFAVLLLVEATDVIFAVDSVPAVLAVSHEPFIVFSSNAFAILGLRALYFLLADLHNRFRYLQTGLAFILAFVGVKMILTQAIDYHMPTWISLPVIGLILAVSIIASLASTPDPDDHFPSQVHDDASSRDDAATDSQVAEAVSDAATGEHAPRT
jgi:tellurite resistance protein TerC